MSYHLSSGFFMIVKLSQALNNVHQTVQSHINDINMYESDSIISLFTPMTSVKNTPKKIILGGPFWDEFTSEYYNDKNDAFGILFQQCKASAIDNIYHPPTVLEWKYSMYR